MVTIRLTSLEAQDAGGIQNTSRSRSTTHRQSRPSGGPVGAVRRRKPQETGYPVSPMRHARTRRFPTTRVPRRRRRVSWFSPRSSMISGTAFLRSIMPRVGRRATAPLCRREDALDPRPSQHLPGLLLLASRRSRPGMLGKNTEAIRISRRAPTSAQDGIRYPSTPLTRHDASRGLHAEGPERPRARSPYSQWRAA